MRKFLIALSALSMLVPAGAAMAQHNDRDRREAQRDHRDDRRDDRRDGRRDDRRDNRRDNRRAETWRDYNRYDYNRRDPRYGGYDASRYYRDGRYYRTRTLGRNDRIYRGNNGRYYCRRDDGTTGLIIGGLAGGALGNTVASGGSETLGTLLGAGVGALLGREIDRGGVKCR